MKKFYSLLVAVLTAVAAFAQETTSPPSPADQLGWQLAVHSWTFQKFSIYDAIDKAAEVGVKHMTISGSYNREVDGKLIKLPTPSLTDGEFADIQAHLKAKGLSPKFLNMGVVKPGTNEVASRKIFEAARRFGIEVLVAEPETHGRIEELPQVMDVVEKLAVEFNIKVAIHNHPPGPNGFYWNPDTVLAAINGRSPLLGVCADVGHYVRSGLDPVEVLKKLEGRLIALHFKDLNEKSPQAHDVPWGTGISNAKGMLAELKRQKFKGVFCVEYEHNWENSVPEIAQCVKFWNAAVAELAKEASQAATVPASGSQNHTVVTVEVKNRPDDKAPVAYHAKTVGGLAGFTMQPEPELSRYGGWKVARYRATGFFRTEKIGDRWWIIDPEGYPYLDRSVVDLKMGNSDRQQEALVKKFGAASAWIQQTSQLLRENGFTGAGCWSDADLIRSSQTPLVYTVNISPMQSYREAHRKRAGGTYRNAGWQGYEHDLVMVFDPEFERIANQTAARLAQYQNDPYLLGYFTDNELPWKNDALVRHLIYLPPTDPGYVAAKEWLVAHKGPNATVADVTDKDRQDFNAFYLERYLAIVTQAIRRYDTNHLYLGCRFNQETEELRSAALFRVAGKYMDIISINHYRKWEPDQKTLASWGQWSGRPFLITEWYIKGEDSGLPNNTGAGWLVGTQTERGYFYQNFCLELLKSPYSVGWQWFKYQDNDPENLRTDPSNRDSNKGIVDSLYEPFPNLLTQMKQLNQQAYHLIRYFEQHRQNTAALQLN
jgi:sugar phosphate isomerase/epimerase